MKLVDVWLIFAQVVPWIEVLLHTLIDWMRTEEEEGREVNHHGKAITVGGSKENAEKEMVNIVNRKTPLLKLRNPHGAPFVAVCWNRSARKLLMFSLGPAPVLCQSLRITSIVSMQHYPTRLTRVTRVRASPPFPE